MKTRDFLHDIILPGRRVKMAMKCGPWSGLTEGQHWLYVQTGNSCNFSWKRLLCKKHIFTELVCSVGVINWLESGSALTSLLPMPRRGHPISKWDSLAHNCESLPTCCGMYNICWLRRYVQKCEKKTKPKPAVGYTIMSLNDYRFFLSGFGKALY